MIQIPFEMVDAIIGSGLGFECEVTRGESDDTHTLLTFPIKEDWQMPFLSFVKRLLDKYDNQLKTENK